MSHPDRPVRQAGGAGSLAMTAPRRIGWADLDPAEQAWFADHAGGALRRRDPAYFASLAARWNGWILTGAGGLIGILLLDWSLPTALLLLLATFWLEWLADLLLLALRTRELPQAHVREYEDGRFWQIVAILRGRRHAFPDRGGGPPLPVSLLADLVAGGAATALLLRGMQAAGTDPLQAVGTWSLWLAIAAVLLVATVPALRFRLGHEGAVGLPVFRFGQRGIGLLLLAFAMMALGSGVLPVAAFMASLYAFMLLMGAIERVFGVPRAREETEWMRRERARQGGR